MKKSKRGELFKWYKFLAHSARLDIWWGKQEVNYQSRIDEVLSNLREIKHYCVLPWEQFTLKHLEILKEKKPLAYLCMKNIISDEDAFISVLNHFFVSPIILEM